MSVKQPALFGDVRRDISRLGHRIFVADDDATAQAYVSAPNSPYRYYYSQLLTKLKRSKRAEVFKTSREQPDTELTVESVSDSVVIAGSPNKVVDQILAFREQVGDFGTLLYAGKDWADIELGRRSMILAAEEVLPRVSMVVTVTSSRTPVHSSSESTSMSGTSSSS